MTTVNRSTSDGSVLLISLSLFALISIMSVGQGFQYLFLGELPAYFAYLSLVFFLALALLSYAVLRVVTAPPAEYHVSTWLGLALMGASFLGNLYFKSRYLMGLPWWLAAAATLAAALAATWRWGARGGIVVFWLAGAMLLAVLHFTMPPGGDMLMTIQAAGKEFLAGRQPYRPYPEIYPPEGFEFSRNLVLSYLPGLWLAYLPPIALGLAPKLLNIAALLLMLFVVERRLPFQGDRAPLLAVTVYPFLLSHLLFDAVMNVHTWPYWLFAAAIVLGLHHRQYLLASICFGLALATRQSALFLAGPIFMYLTMQLDWKRIAFYSAVALTLFALVCLPFAMNWPYELGFVKHLFLRFTGATDDLYLVYKFSAAWYMQQLGIVSWGTWLQIGIIASTMLLLKILAITDAARFSLVLGAMFLWLVFFNPYAVPYVYYPGMIFILLGLLLLPMGLVVQSAARQPDRSSQGSPETAVLP